MRELDSIVITGMGAVAPMALSADALWDAVAQCRCGMSPLTAVESALPAGSDGGEAPALPFDYLPGEPREVRYLRRAIDEALAQSKWAELKTDADRRAILLGTTLHGMRAGGAFLRSGDARELRTFLAGDTLRLASQHLKVRGPSMTTCSACSSSLDAIALGVTLLETGQADVVIAGGYDTISEYVWAGFNSLRLVSGPPLRPFVRGRAGMKISEGYGIVVLERAKDAQARGVEAIAHLAGWGESADSFHLTRPQPDGGGAARSMRMALRRANLDASQIDLIAAHATGTPDNDAAEAAAIALVTEGKPTPVVGFKSHLGHTLGGAGAVELILAAQAMRRQQSPGCCGVVAEEVEYSNISVQVGPAKPATISATLNTSLGFGGANTSAVLRRQAQPRAADDLSEVVITGIGIVGDGLEGTLPVTPLAELENHLDARKARRLSLYVKLMLAASSIAVKNANLPAGATENASAILGSTHGSPAYSYEYYSQIVRDGVAAANPMLFAEGVPNAGAAHVSLTFGIKGGCRTIIGTRTAGMDALRIALLRIANGDVPLAIVGAAEEAHSIIDQAYRSCDANAPASRSAAVALVLEPRAAAEARGAASQMRVTLAHLDQEATNDGLFSVGPLLRLLGTLR